MIKDDLSRKEVQEVLLDTKEDIAKVVEAVVNDCIDTPTDKEEFIEAGLNVSYRLINKALDKGIIMYSLDDILKLN